MATCSRYDFHIHTKYLGCGNSTMEIPAIVNECKRLGVKALGITDHLNDFNSLRQHRPILNDINMLNSEKIDIYFGVEVNFTEAFGGFPFNKSIKEEYGFQFAIGGVHSIYVKEYSIKKIIEVQHQHHLLTCENPLVDVLVHPYWFGKYEFDNNNWEFIDTMKVIPKEYTKELGRIAKETKTAIEINASMLCPKRYSTNYVKEYIEYLAILAGEGVTFSVGSDAHDIKALEKIQYSWDVVEYLKIPPERIWIPKSAPLKT